MPRPAPLRRDGLRRLDPATGAVRAAFRLAARPLAPAGAGPEAHARAHLRARAADGGSAAAPAAAAATGGSAKADEALTRENRDLRARLEDLRARFDKETAARTAAERRVAELEQSLSLIHH